MPEKLPQRSHITRKHGIYHYRRRLPGHTAGEVTLSLATRAFREAEHRAAMIDGGFGDAWGRALSSGADGARLAAVLREYLRQILDEDVTRRLQRSPGAPVYAYWWEPGDEGHTRDEADLCEIRNSRESVAATLANNWRDPSTEEQAEHLAAVHGIPGHLLGRLVRGMIEARLEAWAVAERRSLGMEPLVFQLNPPTTPQPPHSDPPIGGQPTPPATPSSKPVASTMVEPFFTRRQTTNRTTYQVMGQERGTLRRFIEVCGDRPVDQYGRGDITQFLDALRRLPNTYGRSPKDKDSTVRDLIEAADAAGSERLTDKTVKRHLSVLSQFFQFSVDQGHTTVTARNDLVEDHQFRQSPGARGQRDIWTPEDLAALFASPVWRGCHMHFRAKSGPEVIRDAKFWLPILALYHGARLEEFADLYRRDVARDGGQWFINITEANGRRLKTRNAERTIPLHPEVLRLGFLSHIQQTAPRPDDPLFPDIEPQGKDRKRGPRITRWFVEYRRAIGVYREGVGMHAFRHTARTRLGDVIQDAQQERHVDFLMGHGRGGSEGRQRYDKGPGLVAMAETLGLLRFPELDLSHLYVLVEQEFEAAAA